MSLLTPTNSLGERPGANSIKNGTAGVVDLLKGVVMIVLSLGYVCDYFKPESYLRGSFDPGRASFDVVVKWVTSYMAPVFIFLTGLSAWLNGEGRSRAELSMYLLKRGLILVCAELFVSAIGNGFNPSYPFFHLNVIWTTGISLVALSALVFLSKSGILSVGMLAIASPVVLQTLSSEEHPYLVSPFSPAEFVFGHCSFALSIPVFTAIGMIALGYYVGNFYRTGYLAEMRKTALLFMGVGAIAIFFALRVSDPSTDATQWSREGNAALGILLFLDVTNHSSYILYSLITLGPVLILLATFEKPLNWITRQIAGFGRLAFYYFVIHIFLLHMFAESGKLMAGYVLSEFISTRNPDSPSLVKPHALEFSNVYFLLIGLVVLLYTCRRWIDGCQKNLRCTHQSPGYL